jgi:outer membrane protein OmpA-like peptidoglycan-associated protein
MKNHSHLVLLPLVALACASTGPTPELMDARRAYDNARAAPQAKYTPDRVLEAKQALEQAERAHQDDAGSREEKDLAYIATRRAELAVVYGDYELDRRNREAADVNYRQRQDQLRRDAEGTAAQSQRELQGTRDRLGTVQTSLVQEQQARRKAESAAAAAMASLAEVAKVKEESRGTVITLDGSVLFVSGKSDLLPIAQKKLDDVAKALNDTNESQKITIEGHTDSNGNDDSNLRLSRDRAEAVRSYLVSRGVKSERVEAVGKGETTPVASNDTAEGRANNRRVEIIVQKAPSQ